MTPPAVPRSRSSRGTELLAIGGLVLMVVSLVGFMLVDERLVTAADRWAEGSAFVGLLLGWVPVGGGATYGAAVLVWRARRLAAGRSVTRVLDRLAIAVGWVWVGLAAAFLPSGRADGGRGWRELIAVPGPDFADAASRCADGVLVTMGLGAVLGAVLLLRPPRSVDGAVLGHLWAAVTLGLPYLGVLLLVVAGS